MSAYRDLVERGDADHTQLTRLEFVLYVEVKAKGGSPVISEAATELDELYLMRNVVNYAQEIDWDQIVYIAKQRGDIEGAEIIENMAAALAVLEPK